jgi:hypothetical protein
MTNSKLILTAFAAALMLGVFSYAAMAAERAAPAKSGIVIAADDSAKGSAKMGEDEGTNTGEDQGATPENDTQKIDQPPRRDPGTSNESDEDDDVMPPPEDEDDATPSDDSEPQDE